MIIYCNYELYFKVRPLPILFCFSLLPKIGRKLTKSKKILDGLPRKEWNRIYPIKLDTGWYASLPRSICVCLLDSFGLFGKKAVTVAIALLLSYVIWATEKKTMFSTALKSSREANLGFLTEVRFDVADRSTVLIMRCLFLIECEASHGEIRITNMANDLWYNIYVIKDGGNRKNTIWNRHMVATWKSFGRSLGCSD